MVVHQSSLAARALPQLSGAPFLTDGGIETSLIFHDGIDLPLFAAFVLLENEAGRDSLRRYYRPYLETAEASGAGFILESPTWRASRDWGEKLGRDADTVARLNRTAIDLLAELRDGYAGRGPVVISGCVGPRGDGYSPATMMTGAEARAYHAHQIDTFAQTAADMVTAITMTHAGEAIGVAAAAWATGLPVALSFTVETDGRLPSGQALGDAIAEVDAATDGYPAYYMINCAHPSHFDETVRAGGAWTARIRGVRANASRLSHAELDAAETLDDGDPAALGQDYATLKTLLPNLTVFGGCCGTDHRHVQAMAKACV
ncbi:MAG: homocysteine S-methyltransferase family protein [Inquilinaceae bacterium]